MSLGRQFKNMISHFLLSLLVPLAICTAEESGLRKSLAIITKLHFPLIRAFLTDVTGWVRKRATSTKTTDMTNLLATLKSILRKCSVCGGTRVINCIDKKKKINALKCVSLAALYNNLEKLSPNLNYGHT